MSNFIKKIDRQTSIKTKILEESILSYRAKGIYSYLVSRPDGWKYNMTNIINISTDGKESVQKGIKELEKVGLLKRVKAQNSEGKFSGWDWEIYDTYKINTADKRENRQSGKPSDGKAVHIINNINEKKKRKKIHPTKVETTDNEIIMHYPRFATTSRFTSSPTP